MKTKKRNCNLEFRRMQISMWVLLIMLFWMLNERQTFAQNSNSANSAPSESGSSNNSRTLFGGTITNCGYGGIVLKFSGFTDQFAFMTGGRVTITINNRYTIGGGGYGIANSIHLLATSQDTNRYFKLGYGGVELGYIFFPGKKGKSGGIC